jgi:hypothetical protein
MILARCLFRMVFLRQNIVSLMLINKHQQEHGGSLSLVADSLQYAYMKAQVEYIILPFKKRLDGFTYWQRELEPAIHPALKAYVKAENATGGVSSVMIFWEIVILRTITMTVSLILFYFISFLQ